MVVVVGFLAPQILVIGPLSTALIAAVAVVVAVAASAAVGPFLLPVRRYIVQPVFPYLRWGYLFVILPGLPFSLFGALLEADDVPIVPLVMLSWGYELVALLGALIFVFWGRRAGIFEADISTATGHERLMPAAWLKRHAAFLTGCVLAIGLVVMAVQPPSRHGLFGDYRLVAPEAAETAGKLTLRKDGSYRLCQPGCGEGRFILRPFADSFQDRIEFTSGPMLVFMRPERSPGGGAYETSIVYSRMGIEISIGDRSFVGGCYLGWRCR